MKKYFTNFYKNFANTYTLCWTDNKEDEEAVIAEGYEQITRKKAIKLCIEERERVKRGERSFADSTIHKYHAGDGYWDYCKETTKDGYIYEPISKNAWVAID